MKRYEIFLDETKEHFTTALVKDPAVEQTLLYFNSEKPLLFFNDEKRVIYSIAMRPNKLIFRKDVNGEPGEVFYSKETVEKFQQNYFKFNGQNKTNINHSDEKIQGVYPFESWIVMDAEIDKSKVLGLNTQNDDLVMGFKVENDQVWNDCKNGNIDGLSIEAHFNNELREQKPIIKMSKLEKVIEAIKTVFASDVDPEKEKTPEEIAAEEKAKEEEMAVDPQVEIEVEKPNDLEAENEQLKAKVAELEAKLAEYEADKVKSETELETMKSEKDVIAAAFEKFKSETPAAQPIRHVPIEVEKTYEQMTNLEKLKFNREN